MLRPLLASGGALIAGLLLLGTLFLARRAFRVSSAHGLLVVALGLSCIRASQGAWDLCAFFLEAAFEGRPTIGHSRTVDWLQSKWLWELVLACWAAALGLSLSGRLLLVPAARSLPWTRRLRGVLAAGVVLIGMGVLDEHLQTIVGLERFSIHEGTSRIEFRAEREPAPVPPLEGLTLQHLQLGYSGALDVVALALDDDGRVWRWQPWSRDVRPVALPTSVSSISLLGAAVCSIGLDGLGACGGSSGDPDALPVPPSAWQRVGMDRIADLETCSLCGGDRGLRTCALFEDGRGRCWHAEGRLRLVEDEALGDDLVAITTAFGCVGCGAHRDGSTRCSKRFLPGVRVSGTVQGLHGALFLASDIDRACAIDGYRSLVCWEFDRSHQDIRSGTGLDLQGHRLLEGERVEHVAVGPSHSCAVTATGTVFCWGRNDWGQLGDGSTTHSAAPVQVLGIDDATHVTIAGAMACAVHASKAVSCWGKRPRFRD